MRASLRCLSVAPDRISIVGLEAVWFNQFEARERPSPECEPRDSPVFQTWFLGYFDR